MTTKTITSEVREVVRLLPPQLVSSTVFTWTYPFSIFLAVATTPVKISGAKELLLWMLLGFLAHSAMYPFVYYAKSVKKLSDQFLLVILMGIARGSVVGLVAPLMGLQDSLPVPQRIYNSTLAVFYWMQAGAVIVQYGAIFKETVKKLLTEILEKGIVNLPEVAKSSTSELVAIIGHLQENIVKTVGSKPSRAEIEQASSEIDSLIDTHIRPLSQSGWKDGNLVWIRAGFFAVPRRTITNQKIPVIPVIVLTFPFSLIVQITRIGLWATLVVQITWISLVVILDRFILPKVSTERGYAKVNLLFLGSLIILMYPVTFTVQNLLPFGTPTSQTAMVVGYLISSVTQTSFFLIGAMLFSIQSDQGFAFQFLSDIIKKGELEELLKQTQSGNQDSKFAQYVHAEVQSQLLACKLLLLKAAESDFELFPPEITKQIIDRMEKIKTPYLRPVARITSDRVQQLSQSWLGLADISHSLSPELHQLQSYSDITSQLIEEAVVNAIRHGKATKISIESRNRSDLLEVVITDNGKLGSNKSKGGLGTILFNTFTQDWKVSDISGQTVLTFAIATQPPGVSR